MDEKNASNPELSLIQAIASGSEALQCMKCGITELVLALDESPLDEAFIANYLCEECEVAEGACERTAE